jgi:xanthine dehydrogenase accessory factor
MALEEERPICVVTVVESGTDAVAPGSRLVVMPSGASEGSLGHADIDAEAVAAAAELLEAERSEIRTFADDVRAFVEVLEPPVRLVICGAGHDAIPLVRAASVLGWRTVVVDDREAFLTRERFPEATSFVHVETPEEAAKAAQVDARSYAVVMTHNYLRDRAYLRSLLGGAAPYIGMLGPAARTQRLLMDLAEEGVDVPAERREAIHGPAGLDLGSDGPEEIAQSILAEIVAVRRRRQGGFLKERPGPIHDRPRPGAEAR